MFGLFQNEATNPFGLIRLAFGFLPCLGKLFEMIPIVFPASEPVLEAIDIDRIVSPDFAAGFAVRLKRQGMYYDSLTARSQSELFDVVFFSFVVIKNSIYIMFITRFNIRKIAINGKIPSRAINLTIYMCIF